MQWRTVCMYSVWGCWLYTCANLVALLLTMMHYNNEAILYTVPQLYLMPAVCV